MFIINFHNIVAGAFDPFDRGLAPRLDITQFLATIDWLSEHFEFIPLNELISKYGQARVGAPRVVALTFDDGYLGVLENAFPILQERGIVASVMVVTQVLEAPRNLFHFEELEMAFRISSAQTVKLPGRGHRSIATSAERIACLTTLKQELKLSPEAERQYCHQQILHHLGVTREKLEEASDALPVLQKLNVDQLKFLVESGWTVGAHTHTHRTLSCLPEEEMLHEIIASRDALQAEFGPTELPFAYPYGGPQHIGASALNVVASSGFSCGLTTTPGDNTPGTERCQLRRINVEELHRGRPDILIGQINSHVSQPPRS